MTPGRNNRNLTRQSQELIQKDIKTRASNPIIVFYMINKTNEYAWSLESGVKTLQCTDMQKKELWMREPRGRE